MSTNFIKKIFSDKEDYYYMVNQNCTRKGCKDIFRAFLVKDADYEGEEEIPCVRTSNLIPTRAVAFSKATFQTDYNQWLHFYEDDYKFEKLWSNPERYLPLIKKFQGVISPDFSLYYDMPECMQVWNTYRGKALAHWLDKNGVEVIPNVRWGDERTFEVATLGVEKGKTIAVGTHGCIKTVEGRNMFINGFDYVVKKLQPQTIVVYGRMPRRIFGLAEMYGIKLVRLASEFELSHQKGVA
jgi:hypothetical protein